MIDDLGTDERYRERGKQAQYPQARPRPSRHGYRPLHGLEHAGREILCSEWPTAERALRQRLRRLPLTPADVDDVCQDIFERLLRRAYRLERTDVRPLALVGGWNLGLNVLRARASRAVPVGVIPERPGVWAAEDEARWRIDLERTLDALATMTPADQDAVVEHLFGEPRATKVEQDRQSGQLFRARARLRAKVGPVFTGLPMWRWRLSSDLVHAASAVAATAIVVGALSFAAPSAPAPENAQEDPAAPSLALARASDTPRSSAITAQVPDRAIATDLRTPTRSSTTTTTRPPTVRIAAPGPTDTGGGIDTTPRQPGEGLACLSAPHAGVVCVPHPLRR